MPDSIVITISIDRTLYKRLKEYALSKYGNRKGALKMAIEEMIRTLVSNPDYVIKRLEKGYKLGPPPRREELHDRY